ncbi:MAG TPA: stage II sporulation protein R [Firmicutes bacterium]|nr:stage II sporulation protein R [Bacillota bacterium]
MIWLKLHRWSCYIVGVTFILGLAIAIGNFHGKPQPAQPSWQVHSSQEPVLRLHVIASSDISRDQVLKEQVAGLVRRQLGRRENFSSVEDCLTFVQRSLPRLEQEVRSYVQEFAPEQQVLLTITREHFPLRTYGTQVFPPGKYLALKVVLGSGQGENWWCLLFPSLCVTLAETQSEHDQVDKAGTDKKAEKKPVYRRFKIWEWFEGWF